MADYSPFRIALLSETYPVTYDAFVTELQARAQEQENAREGQATLLANMQRRIVASVGLTQDFNANGFRYLGAPSPTASSELVNKAYADGLAFSAALPAISQETFGLGVTNDGAVARWGHSAAEAAGVLNGWFGSF